MAHTCTAGLSNSGDPFSSLAVCHLRNVLLSNLANEFMANKKQQSSAGSVYTKLLLFLSQAPFKVKEKCLTKSGIVLTGGGDTLDNVPGQSHNDCLLSHSVSSYRCPFETE